MGGVGPALPALAGDMTILLRAFALSFCRDHASADAVQVQSLRPEPDGRGGTYDHVHDIAEFRSDWGTERASGVTEWLLREPRQHVRVSALRLTGERHGADEGWEETAAASLVVPPSKGA